MQWHRWLRPLAAAGAGAVIVTVVASLASAAPAPPTLRFTVAATTPLKLTDIVWTGTRFFYVDNTTNRVFEADRSGKIGNLFATMPNIVEETRCVASPSRYGYPAKGLFCHSPDNKIYRLGPDGAVSVFATIPETEVSDGALAVDTVGKFGHTLVAATGRSGNPGGSVYTIDAKGAVKKIGSYPGPGGAECLVIAPASFGSQAGSALLSLDVDASHGSVVAVNASGTATTIAELSDGANPIAVIPRKLRTRGVPAAGFYLTDTFPGTVLLAAASQFKGHEGEVVVGSEVHGRMWLVAPSGSGFKVTELPTNLTAASYNLEGAVFVP